MPDHAVPVTYAGMNLIPSPKLPVYFIYQLGGFRCGYFIQTIIDHNGRFVITVDIERYQVASEGEILIGDSTPMLTASSGDLPV